MKRFLLTVSATAVFALSGQAQATVIFEDTFDQYENMAEFGGTWNADGSPEYQLDTSFGNNGHSVRLVSPSSGNGTSNRYYHNLGRSVNGTDEAPLVFSFDLYLSSSGAPTWNGAYHGADLRSYSGGTYKNGDLVDLLGMTVYGTSEYYQARLMHGGVPYLGGFGNFGYLHLNGNPAAKRSAGWHHFEARITRRPNIRASSRVDFYVDGLLSAQAYTPFQEGFSSVQIGFGQYANGHVMWLDNIRLELLPEPSAMLLLVAGALMSLRRRPARRSASIWIEKSQTA